MEAPKGAAGEPEGSSREWTGAEKLGPYEVRGELGRGAMARVWRAWDPNLGREVAIKEPMFDQNLPADVLDEMGKRFVREAKTAANLNHPGIVTIYAADVYDGRPAIVMELVEGATLGDILESSKSLDPATALDALDQLLDAVGYAHKQGVVHRDIKPDNIFVSADGRVKLADFGIARVGDGAATRATMVGTVLGTPGYMSPEQAKGDSVDARSDLFSIGVVGYEMLSGKNPFGAGDGSDSTTLLYRIVHEPAADLPETVSAGLPADLRPAIMAALSKDPAMRPQSAEAFKNMLHGGALPAPSAVPVQSGLGQAASGASKGPAPKWLPYAIVAAVCAIAVAIVFFMATSGGGGGSTGSAGGSASTSSASVYLAVKDGKVAIYTNSSTEPYEVSQVDASDLDEADREELSDHIAVSSVEEAQVRVREYESYVAAKERVVYLAAKGGKVAIFEGSSKEPYEVSGVSVSDLDESDQEDVEGRIEFDTLEEARAQIREYEDDIAARTPVVSSKPSSNAMMYVVNCNEFITLRSQPDASSGELDRIPLGASVSYIEDAGNGFYKISYGGQVGYGLASYLSSSYSGAPTTLLRVVNCDEWVSLRTQPDTSASVITRIPLGDSARYIGSASNGFYQVSYNGQVGYVLSQYLTEW